MKHVLLTLCLATALHAQQPAAAPHTFTSTDGRKLTATIIEKTATTVTIRRGEDGKDFILQLDQLSAPDQAFVKTWGTKLVPLVMADPALPESWVVEPKYDIASDFARFPGATEPMFMTFENRAKPGTKTQDHRQGLIRSDGLVICDPDKNESFPKFFLFKDSRTSGKHTTNYFRFNREVPKLSGEKWGIVDVDGRQVVPPQWDSVGSFSEGLFDFTLAGKRGYANLKGEVVIQPQWAYAEPFTGGYAIVRASKDGKPSVIDQTGKIISNAVWDEVEQLRVRRGGNLRFDKPIFDYRPDELPTGVFWVSLNKKWGLYDIAKNAHMGEIQWDAGVDYAHDFEHGRAWVLRDGKYGMIDLTGKVVLEPAWEGEWKGGGSSKYHSPPTRVGNCIKAAKDGKTAWWHLDGTPALPDGIYADVVLNHLGNFQIKIESGKLIRVEKNFHAQVPSHMVLRRGGKKYEIGQMVGLADMEGKLLGEVQASWIYATPSPDYFKLLYHAPRCGLIDSTGKVVEPVAEVNDIPLDTLQISHPESLPDGEIVAAFKGIAEAGTSDALFIQTKNGLTKVPWKAPEATIQEAPGTVSVKPHQKDGKWGYIKLVPAKP